MCSLASQTCPRTGLLNCCHGIGTIRTCRWSLELGIMLYAIRGPRRVLSFHMRNGGLRQMEHCMDIDLEGQFPFFLCDVFDILEASITVVIFCWRDCLISESMGHHDSEI